MSSSSLSYKYEATTAVAYIHVCTGIYIHVLYVYKCLYTTVLCETYFPNCENCISIKLYSYIYMNVILSRAWPVGYGHLNVQVSLYGISIARWIATLRMGSTSEEGLGRPVISWVVLLTFSPWYCAIPLPTHLHSFLHIYQRCCLLYTTTTTLNDQPYLNWPHTKILTSTPLYNSPQWTGSNQDD